MLEGASVVSTIAHYPTYVHFFSTAEKLVARRSAVRRREREADAARRAGVLPRGRAALRDSAATVRARDVDRARRATDSSCTRIRARTAAIRTEARAVVVATGYFGSPNYLRVPGEDLPHVTHVYREGHEAFDQDVVVVGGGNSAAEAALDLWRSGARVTLVHFGPTFDKKIKPWVLPDFRESREGGEHRARGGTAASRDRARVRSTITSPGGEERLPADLVYVMTGFAPNMDLLRQLGVPIDAATGIPSHDPETLETTVPGVFIAGVVVAGFDANKVFIENGRYHGDKIVARILGTGAPPEPKLSAELDT